MLFFVVTYLKYTLERNHMEAQTRMWTSYSSKQDFVLKQIKTKTLKHLTVWRQNYNLHYIHGAVGNTRRNEEGAGNQHDG